MNLVDVILDFCKKMRRIKGKISALFSGTGRVPDQLVNLDMKHGVEAKNYEEVSVGGWCVCFLFCYSIE